MSSDRAKMPATDHFVVRIKYGPYRGSYDCYCSVAAFRMVKPRTKIVVPWWEGQEGDWVKGDDGFVAKVLKRTEMKSKSRPNRRPTIVIRVPWGSYPYYRRADGTSKHKMRYVDAAYKHRGMTSLASRHNYRHGVTMNKRKKMFAYYWLVEEMNPVLAYMKAFKTPFEYQARKGVSLLFRFEKYALMKEIQNHYRELFDKVGLDDENIATEITALAKSKGVSKVKLDALRLALEIRGEVSTGGTTNVNNGMVLAPVPMMQGGQVLAPPPEVVELDDPDAVTPAEVTSASPSPSPSEVLFGEMIAPPAGSTSDDPEGTPLA